MGAQRLATQRQLRLIGPSWITRPPTRQDRFRRVTNPDAHQLGLNPRPGLVGDRERPRLTLPPTNDSERAAKATAAQARTRLRHERRAKIAARVERLTYSVEEVSVMLGRDPATIHRWIKSGAIASVKIGGARMIPVAELNRIANGDV